MNDEPVLKTEWQELQAKYEKALDFIEDLSNQYCSSEHVDVWAKKADKLLKELEG